MNSTWFPDAEMLQAESVKQQRWHDRAAETARARFGRAVFVRGVVEVSNYCRENCHYCGMRRDNRALARYRAKHDQLAELLVHHRPASITDVNIQSGEDLIAVREVVLPLVRTLRRETNLGVSVCLGTLTPAVYDELRAAGASIYIIKFEMADEQLYGRMGAPGTFSERVSHIRQLAADGWHVSSGFIAGLPGQSVASLLENFHLSRKLPLSGCSVSPFIPGEATPLAAHATASLELTLNCMAALRLQQPGLVIPAVSALNLAGPEDGYQRGLRAGANLCTINLTPTENRVDYLLYRRERFIMNEERILSAIEGEGLQPAKQGLARWLAESAMRGAAERTAVMSAAQQ